MPPLEHGKRHTFRTSYVRVGHCIIRYLKGGLAQAWMEEDGNGAQLAQNLYIYTAETCCIFGMIGRHDMICWRRSVPWLPR